VNFPLPPRFHTCLSVNHDLLGAHHFRSGAMSQLLPNTTQLVSGSAQGGVRALRA
jgi:hypothetical protein